MLPFITKFDAANRSTGSIDPLGALQVYVSLVDHLLPGLSTITSRIRYVSMVAAALDTCEGAREFPIGPAAASQRRKAAEAFERLWALACVCAEETTREAADGLRGVRGARRALLQFQGEHVAAGYRLLKDQSRTGGIPTYWVTLANAKLVDGSAALHAEGRDLARCFPAIPLGARELRDLCTPGAADRVRLSQDSLREWAGECHLMAYGEQERRLLADVLRADARRDCVRRMLLSLREERPLPDRWTIADLRSLQSRFERDGDSCALQLPAVVGAVIAVERFHEAVLAVFDGVLFWATKNEKALSAELEQQDFFKLAAGQAIERANRLSAFDASDLPRAVRPGFEEFRVFARTVGKCLNVSEVLETVMQRHRNVQAGKVSGGVPKREWVVRTSSARMLRPSPQFQRMQPPAKVQGKSLTHPYRLEQFVGMLREVGALKAQPA